MANDLLPASPADGPRDEDLESRFEKIDRTGALRPGEYWRAKVDQKQDGWTIPKGDVLLVADVRMDGDHEHRVDLIPPPSCGSSSMRTRIRILVGDFEEKWEPAPDAEVVRAKQMADIQRRAKKLQDEIVEAQTNPAYLNAQVLKAITKEAKQSPEKVSVPARIGDVTVLNVLNVDSPSLSDALGPNAPMMINQTLDLVRDAHQIAEAQGKWFAEKARLVGSVMGEIVPYYEEKAQVALARTSRAIQRAKTLLESVSTLTLFTGEDVEVLTIREGTPAPSDAPIHLYQRKLWADEECSYLREYVSNNLETTKEEDFHIILAKESILVDQMVPMPRSVALCGLTRRDHLYGDNPLVNYLMRRRNTRSFLVVRDGDRVFIVLSPVESHEQATRLFPEKDIDGSVFKHLDGQRVTPEDLIWTDKLDALHRQAVHYRRYLVLLAGLVSREIVWQGVNFTDMFEASKTEDLFRLIRDDSGEGVVADGRPTLKAFVAENQQQARAGSRLMVDLMSCLTKETSRHCFSTNGRGEHHLRVRPEPPVREAELEREGNTLLFRTKVLHEWRRSEMPVKVTLFYNGRWARPDGGAGWLCVDRLDVAGLDRLMSSRSERSNYIGYMALFRAARDRAQAIEIAEGPTRDWLVEQLMASGLTADQAHASDLVNEALTAWRAGGDPLPEAGSDAMTSLLNRLYRQTERGKITLEELEPAAKAAGLTPLRLALAARGAVRLYALPRQTDDRGAPQYEVERWNVQRKRTGLSFEPLADGVLPAVNAEETVLHEWEAAASWKRTGLVPAKLFDKRKAIDFALEHAEFARALFAGPISLPDRERFFTDYQAMVSAYVQKHRTMPSVDLTLPIGIVTHGDGTYVVWLRDRVERVVGRNMGEREQERVLEIYRENRCRVAWLERLSKIMATTPTLDHVELMLTKLSDFTPALFAEHQTYYSYASLGTDQDAAMSHSENHTAIQVFERIAKARGKVLIRHERYSREPLASHVWFLPDLDLSAKSPLMSWFMKTG